MIAPLLAALLAAPAAGVVLPDGSPLVVPEGRPVEPRSVVLVTLDGVRWQDFLDNKPDAFLRDGDKAPTFPGFWSTLAPQGVVYDRMTISNGAVLSMPAYQSIFAGARQPCRDNECARVGVETFPERLVRELALPKAQVAAFASWDKIPLAFESVPGATVVDAGDAGKTRWDDATFPLALAYLKANKPRFLYISLNDPDHWGHAGDYPKYLAALRRSDAWLVELAAALDALGEYGANATLIVTTDHGRGVLWDWRSHGNRPWARRVWLYARNPRSSKKNLKLGGGEHADIRPTIESLMGLAPCAGCSAGLAEVLAP